MAYDKEELIKHRLSKAKESLEDAAIAIKSNRLLNAENRIYYSIFYTVSALAVKYDFSTSKHFQLLGWFNKTFIKTDKVSKEFGKIYKRQFENRLESDYDDFVNFDLEDVKKNYDNAKKFVKELEKLLI